MCGMTRVEDVAHAISLGVDALGFIFYAKSKRVISIKQAGIILRNLPPFVDAVAVMVNPTKEFVDQLLAELPIQLLQFHGDESQEFCQQFNRPFIKAIHPLEPKQIFELTQKFSSAQAVLFDTPSDSAKGGTGLTFDWKLIPNGLSKPYILAGGLNEFNVANAIKMSQPFAVDVCSGIEALPGVKDHMKMNRFIKAIWGI